MRALLFITFFTFIRYLSFSQQAEERAGSRPVPFTDILPQIENYYGIKLSFADELVAGKKVSVMPGAVINKEAFLASLEKQLTLKIVQVKGNYYLIRPYRPNDKISVCGYILNSGLQPLVGAAVLSRNTSIGQVTGENGFFTFTNASYGSLLSINHIGYAVKLVRVKDLVRLGCPVIVVEETSQVLSEVVVKDFLSVGISKVDQSLEIRPEELKILPGLVEPDILESIQQAPGVSSPFETASGIFVRGGSPDQNLVRWNGIKTYSQGHFFGMLSAFNPYITQEVQFIKNGTSARYGDRVSSVIDITSADELPQKISGGAGLNMLYADAYLEAPLVKDKLSLQLSGRRSFNDYLETFTYEQFSERVFQNTKINEEIDPNIEPGRNDFFFHDFSSKIIFKPGKYDQLMVNTLHNKNDLNFSSRTQDQDFSDLLRTENEGYGLSWRRRKAEIYWDMEAYYSKYLLDYEFRTTENDTTDVSSKKNLVSDYGMSTTLTLPISPQSILSTGYQFSSNHVSYAFETETPLYNLILDEDDSELSTHAVFAEYQLDRDRTQLTLGARFNHYAGLQQDYFEPRLVFQQGLLRKWRFNASAEYRSQAVSQIKESVVSDLSLENQVWTLSSTDRFPIIDSYQFSSGFSFENEDWFIDVDAYIKQIQGITTLTFGFLNPVDNEYRRGNSAIKGIDFFVKRRVRDYKTWLGYSYLFTENNFTGINNDQPFPGNWNIEHTIKWSHFYTIKNLYLSLGWYFHTGKSFTNVVEDTNGPGPVSITFDGINEDNLPVYHRLDFSAVYEFHANKNKNTRYRVGVSILNLYNRENLLNREFRTTPSLENELIDTRIYSLGVTPNFVFRVFW
ncbi:MAG: TonB-dependent receptor [Cytophagales bacterium]|nr:TonB-dependent receptor [Cytophagales bacterium]